jgi:hypothetical protein
MVSKRDQEKAFVDCLKGDHTRATFEKKREARESNVKSVILKMSNPSERELQKNKLIGRAEVGGTIDFVDMITPDPFL